MITKDQQDDLHQGSLSGDPTAVARIFLEIIGPLTERLKRVHAVVSGDLVEDCVMRAFEDYCVNPHSYDPERKSLYSYFWMAAQGDIRNALRSAAYRYEVTIGGIGDLETVARDAATADVETSYIEAEVRRHLVEMARDALPSESDRDKLRLILDGERSVEQYAEALGLAHLPPAEKRTQVKRNQDRVKKVLKRLEPKARRLIHG